MYFLDEKGFFNESLDADGRRLSCISGRFLSISVRTISWGRRMVTGCVVDLEKSNGYRISVFFFLEIGNVRAAMRYLWTFTSKKPRLWIFSFLFRRDTDYGPSLIIVYGNCVMFPVYKNLIEKEVSGGKAKED